MNEQSIVEKTEQEFYEPSNSILDNANIKEYDKLYKYSIENNSEYWAEQASQLEWYQKWTKVLDDSNKPFYKWFVGGKFNIITNAIDRHLKNWRKNKLAIIWEGEPGDTVTYS